MKTDSIIKILLVDDRAENLLALEVILSNKNYSCVKANSGREALKILLYEQDFAIILMDVQMPIMDGFETAELIRESATLKNVPIIFLTANMKAPDQIFKGYQAGAVDYMLKPLNSDILKAKVAVFVDLYKKNHELSVQDEKLKVLNNQLEKNIRQLKESEEQIKTIFVSAPDAVITIDEEGIIVNWNPQAEIMFGWEEKEVIGKSLTESIIPERYRERHQKGMQHYLKTGEGRVINKPIELYALKKNNTEFPVELKISASKINDRGTQLFIGFIRDITERKQAVQNAYARTLIEASLDPLVTISTEGKITDMNNAMVTITGIEREKLIGSDFTIYFTEPKKALKIYEEVFAKGFVTNYPLTIKDKLTEVLFNGSVYKDEQGKVLGGVIMARDITALKKFENELIEAKSNAEREKQIAQDAVKSKQQFLSNMSHEIRTPMNAIIGFTNVVLKTELNDKQKEYINAIKVSGDTLIVLINDILDLAKVDAGKMVFEQAPFNLSDSVSNMLHLFDTKIQEKNLELVREYDSAIPEILLGDAVRLNQIILNLLSNAIKFTSQGKITVSVNLMKEDAEKASLKFAVTDTGIGIPKNKLGNIFDDFQQATIGTSRLYGGTGLGLAIVKQLVESQGGELIVESQVGKGSTFGFTMGFKKTKAKLHAEPEIVLNLKKGINIKVLAVEDIVLNQLLMKTLFEGFGFDLDVAGNGKIAIEKLEKNKYDIILMDLQMPVMNGFEATDYIRNKMKSKIPIIALTADVTTVDVEKCKAVGMDDYISKPLDEKLLYSKIVKYTKAPVSSVKIASPKKPVVQKPEKKCTNLSYLKECTKSNSGLMIEMIEIYLQETPQLIDKMKKGIDNNDWESLKNAAHSIIPSFAIVGIKKEFEVSARKLQKDASELFEKKENAKKETLIVFKELFSKIEAVCLQAFDELKIELASLKAK